MEIYFTGASTAVRRELIVHGLKPPLVHYKATIALAKEAVARSQAETPAAPARAEKNEGEPASRAG
jgi:hypothetical protein